MSTWNIGVTAVRIGDPGILLRYQIGVLFFAYVYICDMKTVGSFVWAGNFSFLLLVASQKSVFIL